MEITAELFELTSEERETSEMMYSGKTVRCLVAPYHSYNDLESKVPFTESTFLFPEREMSSAQVRGLISMLTKSEHTDIKIITTDQTIICDMVGDLVRVLTEDGEIVNPHVKTFAANIHDIRYNILENDDYRSSKETKDHFKDSINKLIDLINSGSMTQDEYNSASKEISMIGEVIIRRKLSDMLEDVTIK